MFSPFDVIPSVRLGKTAASLGVMVQQPPVSSDLRPAGTSHTPFSLMPCWQKPSKDSVIAAKIGDGTSSTFVPESRIADLRATLIGLAPTLIPLSGISYSPPIPPRFSVHAISPVYSRLSSAPTVNVPLLLVPCQRARTISSHVGETSCCGAAMRFSHARGGRKSDGGTIYLRKTHSKHILFNETGGPQRLEDVSIPGCPGEANDAVYLLELVEIVSLVCNGAKSHRHGAEGAEGDHVAKILPLDGAWRIGISEVAGLVGVRERLREVTSQERARLGRAGIFGMVDVVRRKFGAISAARALDVERHRSAIDGDWKALRRCADVQDDPIDRHRPHVPTSRVVAAAVCRVQHVYLPPPTHNKH